MSAKPQVKPFPSIEEFPFGYNIPDQYGDRVPVWRSVDRVPEFGFPELWEVYQAAKKWFAEAVPAPPRSASFDPLAEDMFVPRDETDDRTLSIDNVDFSRLNSRLLRRIQDEFLGRYPLWRVHLVGEDPSTGIVIYPTVIRFGNRPADVDPDEALRELVPHALALREARVRPRREQADYLRRRLPDAVRAIGDWPFLIFGVLDHSDGNYSRLTVCLLIRGADRDAIVVDAPAGCGDDFLWRASPVGVNAEGIMICHGPLPESTPYCLVLWLPPANYRGPLSIVERESGKRHTYELKSENITRTSRER